MTQDLISKRILIFGCGNPLLGDDGFGPAVIEHLLSTYELPDDAAAVDAGTGIRDYLFDLILSPGSLPTIHVVDAVSIPNRTPGELFELNLDMILIEKTSDFCMHQFPSVNLLSEINGITAVRVLAVQAEHIPEVVQPGLSPKVRDAIEPACEWLMSRINPA